MPAAIVLQIFGGPLVDIPHHFVDIMQIPLSECD